MTEFKKYNRKYIIVESFDDTKLPADNEILGEGVVIVYAPSGELSEAEKVKVGDGITTFGSLKWLGLDEGGTTIVTDSGDSGSLYYGTEVPTIEANDGDVYLMIEA